MIAQRQDGGQEVPALALSISQKKDTGKSTANFPGSCELTVKIWGLENRERERKRS